MSRLLAQRLWQNTRSGSTEIIPVCYKEAGVRMVEHPEKTVTRRRLVQRSPMQDADPVRNAVDWS
jgi:hypothetical protein